MVIKAVECQAVFPLFPDKPYDNKGDPCFT